MKFAEIFDADIPIAMWVIVAGDDFCIGARSDHAREMLSDGSSEFALKVASVVE